MQLLANTFLIFVYLPVNPLWISGSQLTFTGHSQNLISLSNPALAILWRVSKFYSELTSDSTLWHFFSLWVGTFVHQSCFCSYPPTHTRIDGAVRPPAALHGLDQTLLNSFSNSTFFLMCLSLLSQQWCFTSLLFKVSLKVWLSIRIFFKENLQRHFCCISVSLDI